LEADARQTDRGDDPLAQPFARSIELLTCRLAMAIAIESKSPTGHRDEA